MEAVILAGGQGTRLRPHTDEVPKPLVSVGGKPIVAILIRQMGKTGVTRICMAVNHLSAQIISAIGDGANFGLTIEYSHEAKPLSTVGPLKLIKNLDDNFIVANADVLTDLNFKTLFDYHKSQKANLTVATYARHNPIDYGVLDVNNNGLAIGFKEKPEFNFVVSMGIYVFSKSILKYVPVNEKFGFDNLMHILLENRVPIHTFPHSGYWLDIGRPDDYQKANDDIDKIRDLID